MHFSTSLSLLLAAATSALAVAIHQPDVYELGGDEQQLPIGDISLKSRTRTVTETQTFFEVVETVYMTKPQLVPTWVPVPVPQVEVEVKVEETCDETKEIGCAVCRTIHECTDFEEECIACDTSPACAACQPPRPQAKAHLLPPVINLGITCSLGPGRTVPCELVSKEDQRGPVYRFGEGA